MTIPVTAGLDAGQTAVYYGDEQVGLLSSLSADENNEEILKGTLLIDPNQANLLKTNTRIVLKNRKLDLGDVANPKNSSAEIILKLFQVAEKAKHNLM